MNTENTQLKKIENLLKHILAVELYRAGANKAEIKAHLHFGSASTVKKLLKGVKRPSSEERT